MIIRKQRMNNASEQEYHINMLQSSNIIEETMSIYRRKYSKNTIIVINDIIITI